MTVDSHCHASHLASVGQPDRADMRRAERERALALARFPNAFIKVPGLGEFVRRAMPVPTGDFGGTARPLFGLRS